MTLAMLVSGAHIQICKILFPAAGVCKILYPVSLAGE